MTRTRKPRTTCKDCGRTDVPQRLTGPADAQWLVLAQHRVTREDPNSRHCIGVGQDPTNR